MKIKIDCNDIAFSKLVRMNHTVCQRCGKPLKLQCCHIFSRKYYTTRFDEDNAVVLCWNCHNWFDTHKMSACLFDASKRVFTQDEEGYAFLVDWLGYTWDQLEELYHKSRQIYKGYKAKKKDIGREIKEKTLLKEE